MRKYLSLLLLFCMFSVRAQQDDINYITAGDLSYRHLNGNTYEFTYVVYTECSNEFWDLTGFFAFNLFYGSEKLGISDELFQVTKVAPVRGEKVNIFCASQPSNCDVPNGQRGLSRFTYKGEVTLPAKSDDWIVYTQENLRTEALSGSLEDLSIESYYAEVLINNDDAQNDSPVFTGEFGPIARAFVGEESIYDLNLSDPDGNRLEYSIINPRSNASLDVFYADGLSATNPAEGLTITLNNDGTLTMNATQAGQAGITTIKIDEYDGDRLIGSVTRDIQISTFLSENDPPEAFGFKNSLDEDSLSTNICVGESLDDEAYYFYIKDPENDDVNIIVESILKDGNNASLAYQVIDQNDSIVIKFLNTVGEANIGQYRVSIKMEDNGCPFSRTSTTEAIINVIQIPQFDLGEDQLFECDKPLNLAPDVDAGVEPLTYTWELFQWNDQQQKSDLVRDTTRDDTIATSATLDIVNSGIYKLTVVDGAGCINSDTIDYNNGIIARFVFEKFCADSTTLFTDTSTTEEGTIDMWEWDFGDGSALGTLENESHLYGSPGRYPVSITVTNSSGCKSTWIDTVTICPTRTPIINKKELCTLNDGAGNLFGEVTNFEEVTGYQSGIYEECAIQSRKWVLKKVDFDTVSTSPLVLDTLLSSVLEESSLTDPAYFREFITDQNIRQTYSVKASDPVVGEPGLPDTGYYQISLTTQGFSTCTHEKKDIFYVDRRPEIKNNIDDFFINCDDPDSLFHVVFQNKEHGFSDISYQILYSDDVVGNDAPIIFLTYETLESGTWNVQAEDTLFYNTANNDTKLGLYRFKIEDDNSQCEHNWYTEIEYPIEANFKYSRVCSKEDSMTFVPSIDSETNIGSYFWDFGDGKTSDKESPTHFYTDKLDYNVEFIVADTNNCGDTTRINVWNSLPETRFVVEPNDLVSRICVGDQLIGRGYYYPFQNDSARHINSLIWDFDNGNAGGKYNRAGTIASGLVSQGHVYSTPGIKNVYTKIVYNQSDNNTANSEVCELDSLREVPIDVGELFRGDIFSNYRCLGDISVTTFERTVNVDIPVDDYQWYFVRKGNVGSGTQTLIDTVFTSSEPVPEFLIDETLFSDENLENAGLEVFLKVTDENGCVFEDNNSFDIISLDKASLEYDSTCANDAVPITILSPVERGQAEYLLATGPSFSTSISGGTYAVNASTGILDRTTYNFENNGTYPVRLFRIQDLPDPQLDTTFVCRSVFDTTIAVFEIPEPNFIADTVCAVDDSTSFTNLSTMSDLSKIEGYLWDFGDGMTSDLENPKHVFQVGGHHDVNLTVYTDDGCAHDTTISIYSFYKPEADFELDTKFPEAEVPITFYDASSSGSTIDYWEWDFDDGSPKVIGEQDPIYTYDTVLIYFPQLIVENVEGCRDTVIKRTDLNVYLDLPTAFSPNDDQNNDELSLIHKSIKELYVFRIYNRYGEIVFDAEGDLDKVWDGTFKGKLQEVGTYVAHIQALGAYDTTFNFKRNVTLLR